MSTVVTILMIQSAICLGVWAAALAGKRTGVLTVLLGGLFFACLLGPWMLLTWLICGVVVGVAAGRQWSYRPSLAVVAVIVLTLAGVRGFHWSRDVAELQALQRDFPVQSLDERLSQLRSAAVAAEAPVTALRPVNGFASAPLDQLEAAYHEGWTGQRRQMMLRSLTDVHTTVERQFQRREGFGVIRSIDMWPRRELLELPAPEPIPQTSPSDDPGSLPLWTEFPAALPPNLMELQTLHHDGQLSFIDPQSLGYLDVRQAVPMKQAVGFQSHAFRRWPKLERGHGLVWQVTEVELMSLLKETSPAVYQSDHLPNLEHITHNDVPLRPLDAFETAALARLERGEDVVIDDHPGEIRVLGALRAVRQCMDCHSVDRGALLGAFTYRLQPPSPVITVDQDWH